MNRAESTSLSTNITQGNVVALASELIRFPSLTPDRTSAQNVLAERLQKVGFQVYFKNRDGVRNLWAEFGTKGPFVVFSGHTDVVPAGDEALWETPPFEPRLSDGKLYGRGACDMKGAVAAMTVGIEKFILVFKDKLSFRIGVMFTGDEEAEVTYGTPMILDTLKEEQKEIIGGLVGEPSSQYRIGDRIKVGRRGSLTGALRVYGTQGHVAYVGEDDNPIHHAARLIAACRSIPWETSDPLFPNTIFHVADIRAGTGASNVVPGYCDVLFNIRFAPPLTEDAIKKLIASKLQDCPCRFDLTWTLGARPLTFKQGKFFKLVCDQAKQSFGLVPEHSAAGGTSDARYFAQRGIEVVELGPVGSTIHQVNESVSCAELEMLATFYEQVLLRLASSQNIVIAD